MILVCHERSYNENYTPSRPLWEVKADWLIAWLIDCLLFILWLNWIVMNWNVLFIHSFLTSFLPYLRISSCIPLTNWLIDVTWNYYFDVGLIDWLILILPPSLDSLLSSSSYLLWKIHIILLILIIIHYHQYYSILSIYLYDWWY